MALWQRWQALRNVLHPVKTLGCSLLHNEAEAARQQSEVAAREAGGARQHSGIDVFDR
jgi:hypothetical protein